MSAGLSQEGVSPTRFSGMPARAAISTHALDQHAAPLGAGAAAPASGRREGRLVDAGCRALDIVGSAALLVVLAPLLGAIALAVKLDSPGPVLFRQRRLGRDAEPFTVNKFRTMDHGVAHDRHREFVLGLINGEHPGQSGEQNGGASQHDGEPGKRLQRDCEPISAPGPRRAPRSTRWSATSA